MRRIISVLFTLTVPFLSHSQKECNHAAYQQLSLAGVVSTGVVSSNTSAPAINAAGLNKLPEEIVIPVVVHLINGDLLGITDEQVHSQIAALNRDFNARNEDLANLPARFAGLKAGAGIRFELAKVDPAGKASTGIVRRESSVQNFSMDDKIKFSSRGGDNAWPRDHYLNIWVGSLVFGIQGYASLPGAAAEVDGVVLSHTVFGTINKSGRYNLGRVAVHELGHWLGLKHIWGDEYCGDDGIDDTPKQKSYNRGCPSGIVNSCGSDSNGDMYMNFMDLTDDACMFMFTKGQARKMRSAFTEGGARQALLHSRALETTGVAIDQNWEKQEEPVSFKKDILNVYPVPAVTEVKVELDAAVAGKVKNLLVYNMMGQIVGTASVTGQVVVLNVSRFGSGQYMIRTDLPSSRSVRFVKL